MGNYFWKEYRTPTSEKDTTSTVSTSSNVPYKYDGCDTPCDYVEQGCDCRLSLTDKYIYILHYLL